jgi:hypothetical protein
MNDEQAENLADDNTPDDILEDAKEKFQRASDAEADNRRDALDDLRFARLSQQWPDAIKKSAIVNNAPVLPSTVCPRISVKSSMTRDKINPQ